MTVPLNQSNFDNELKQRSNLKLDFTLKRHPSLPRKAGMEGWEESGSTTQLSIFQQILKFIRRNKVSPRLGGVSWTVCGAGSSVCTPHPPRCFAVKQGVVERKQLINAKDLMVPIEVTLRCCRLKSGYLQHYGARDLWHLTPPIFSKISSEWKLKCLLVPANWSLVICDDP